MPYSTKLKGGWQWPRQVVVNKSTAQLTRKEGHTEVYEQISGDNTEQYGTGTQQPSGSLPVPRRWQDIRLSSHGDVTEYSEEPPFWTK